MNAGQVDWLDWLSVLRMHAQQLGQARVALKLGVSDSVVSQVLSGKYQAQTLRIERRVRGALMGETTECPVLWDLPLHVCQTLQERRGAIANEHQQQAWYCCRGAGRFEDRGPCPHFNGGRSAPAINEEVK